MIGKAVDEPIHSLLYIYTVQKNSNEFVRKTNVMLSSIWTSSDEIKIQNFLSEKRNHILTDKNSTAFLTYGFLEATESTF